MFCDTYEHSLKDAAVSGELSATLRSHIDACPACRAAFAEEQSLYAAINSGLHIVANAEVPATLIPRVHVALNNEPISQRTPRFWLLAAVPVFAAGLLLFVYLRPHPPSSSTVTPQNVSNGGATPGAAISSAVNPLPPRDVSTLQDHLVKAVRIHSSDSKSLEVIVEPQEAAALLRYEVNLRRRFEPKPQALLATAIELPNGIQPLEIAEMEVGDLKIPALAKAETDADR